MKSIIYTLLFLSVAVFSTSCDSVNVLQPDGVMVRIQNISEHDVQNVTVNEIEFGDLNAGATSKYMDVEQLYVVGTDVLSGYKAELLGLEQPYSGCIWCGTGMQALPNGRYTLELDVIGDKDESSQMFIVLRLQE